MNIFKRSSPRRDAGLLEGDDDDHSRVTDETRDDHDDVFFFHIRTNVGLKRQHRFQFTDSYYDFILMSFLFPVRNLEVV